MTKTFKTSLRTLLLGVVFLIPHSSEAFLTTDQSVTQLNDTTILYTVTYEFGFENSLLRYQLERLEQKQKTLHTSGIVLLKMGGLSTKQGLVLHWF